ncbi:MAG: formimidoylglutamate deiminase [Holophagales bacterium]|nr:formimidoylglutamate deiminase [Holophagales bacterium]MYI34496.1 formimidoylglutamate deiminase [Holophagales bacterium]
MVTRIRARLALLAREWAEDVLLVIDGGTIVRAEPGAARYPADLDADILIPGLTNAHSHAFQRALAGKTEHRAGAGRDSFWTWRRSMYRLVQRLDAHRFEAIARQAYVEMLQSGYTSVVEFHYLHREPAGTGNAETMFEAIHSAASATGIRLTYVPVLYQRAGFDDDAVTPGQRPFALTTARFLDHQERAAETASGTIKVGIGVHSLRAVGETSLRQVAARAGETGAPMHLHVAEQQREVDECLAAHGQRPVRWLLDRFEIGEPWCLVHATHMDADECRDLAMSAAAVCLCPTTEANLGDGLFPLPDYLRHGGRIAIGSDSHVSINPFEELRWLEYGQRLRSQSRNVASMQDQHVGRELFEHALAGGAQAAGHGAIGLEQGAPADLVVLDAGDPMLAGHDPATLLDALVFSGYRLPIERVMVDGKWRVAGGEHADRSEAARDFARALANLETGP